MSRTSRLFEMLGVLRARRRPVPLPNWRATLAFEEERIPGCRDAASGGSASRQAGGHRLHPRDGVFPNFAFSSEEMNDLILAMGEFSREPIWHFRRAAKAHWRRCFRVGPTVRSYATTRPSRDALSPNARIQYRPPASLF
jgi:hypothetical protein